MIKKSIKNVVIFGSSTDYDDFIFNNDIKGKKIFYLNRSKIFRHKIINMLFRLHFSSKINRFLKLPLKNLWNKMFLGNVFQEPDCIIFFPSWEIFKHTNFFEFLRKRYPDVKLVFF